MRVLGGIALPVAALSLCATSYRLISPEVGLPSGAADKLMNDGVVAGVVMTSLSLIVAISVLLAVAGIGLLLGRRWGRRVALWWAWITVGVEAAAVIANALAIGARAGAVEVGRIDALAMVVSVPGSGICAGAFALVVLFSLNLDTVRVWAHEPNL